MKNVARKLSALLLVFVVSMAALCPAFAASASLPSLPSGQCVVDDANVLSSSTVQTITDLNAQLESSCSGAQIGVLTVDYTGSCTTEEYALQAANAWGIGSSTGNNGVLILLVMETQQYADGDYYIATGDGFRNTTLESQASALAQTMEDDFVRQDYDDAVTTCARNVAQTIADIYGVSLSGGNTNNGSYDEPAYDDNSSSGGFGDILLGFVTILFTIILLLIIVSVIVYTFSGPLSGLFWCFGMDSRRHIKLVAAEVDDAVLALVAAAAMADGDAAVAVAARVLLDSLKKAAFRLCLFVYAVERGNSHVSSRRGIRLKRFDRHIALLSLQID